MLHVGGTKKLAEVECMRERTHMRLPTLHQHTGGAVVRSSMVVLFSVETPLLIEANLGERTTLF